VDSITRVAARRSASETPGSAARLAWRVRKDAVAWALFFTRWFSSDSRWACSATLRCRSSKATFMSVMSVQDPT